MAKTRHLTGQDVASIAHFIENQANSHNEWFRALNAVNENYPYLDPHDVERTAHIIWKLKKTGTLNFPNFLLNDQ